MPDQTVDEVFDKAKPFALAWGLAVSKDPVDSLEPALRALDRQIKELEALSETAGKKYRKEYAKLASEAEKAAKKKKKKDADEKALEIGEKIGELYTLVCAETYVPVREQSLLDAIADLKKRDDTDKEVKEFEKAKGKIDSKKDPKARCAEYLKLERQAVRLNLAQREKDSPGSTWTDYVEFGLNDANPGAKTKDTLDADGLAALKKSFGNWCLKKIKEATFSVPEDKQDAFQKEANKEIKRVVKEVFGPAKAPMDRSKSGELVMSANTEALAALTALKRKKEYRANPAPQLFSHDGKLKLIKESPQVESLVLQGGGGKGIGYPPVFVQMQKTGMLDDVDLLIGTSIGALNAACMACGGGISNQEDILDLGVFSEAYDPKGFSDQYPNVSFGRPAATGKLSSIKNAVASKVNPLPSCAGQMAKMDTMTVKTITDGLGSKLDDPQALISELAEKLKQLDNATLERLGFKNVKDDDLEDAVRKLVEKVKNQGKGKEDRSGKMITFQDLAILHQLDPKKFKELTITGWEGKGKEGKSVYFCAKDFPEMPVALAARISMGLPVFAPVYWTPPGGKERGPFYDGGLGSNAPLEAAPGLDGLYELDTEKGTQKDAFEVEDEMLDNDAPVEVQQAMAKTMLMTFDEGGEAHDKMHSDTRFTKESNLGEEVTVKGTNPSLPLPFTKKRLPVPINPFSTLAPDYDKSLKQDAGKSYNSGVNTMPVYHGDAGTMSLGPMNVSQDKQDYAKKLAEMKALEHLDSRMDQAAVMTCESADDALAALSDREIRRLVAEGKPDSADPLVTELFDKCEAYLVIKDAFDQIDGGGGKTPVFLELVAKSPLCADCKSAVTSLRDSFNVYEDQDAIPAKELATVEKDVGKVPVYLRKMLTTAVLIPLQQIHRAEAPKKGKQGDPKKAAKLLGIDAADVNVLVNLLHSKKLADMGMGDEALKKAAEQINLKAEVKAIRSALVEAGLI